MRRRRPFAAAAALALPLLATAIPVAAQAPAPAGGPTLTMGVEASFGVDPHFLFLGPNMAAARHIYDSLVGRDAESRFTPGLAESWRALDAQTWEFSLRRGVTFQDGSPFTAEDVAFSLARIPALPNNPGPYTSNLRTIRQVEVVDAHTIRLHTDQPNPTLPGQLTNVFIVSARAAGGPEPWGASTAEFTSGRAAIGTGPFRLERFRGAEGMSLARHEGYWGEAPAFARVEMKVMGNDAARLAALLSGDVDLIEQVPPADVARLEKDARVGVFKRNSDRIMYLIPHLGAAALPLLTAPDGAPLPANPLADARVRRALSLAIDREALAARGLDGQAIATLQMVPEGFGGWDPALPSPRPDPEAARRLLAEAGFPQGFGLTLGCSNNRYTNDARVCQAVGQMLTRAGFQAKVETQPGTVFFPRTAAGRNDLPLMLFGLSLSSSRDASYILSTAVHTRDPARGFGQGNRGQFSDPALDARIAGAIIRTGEAREPALRETMRAAIEALPIIPLYNQVTITAARRGIAYSPRMDEQLVATHARPTEPAR